MRALRVEQALRVERAAPLLLDPHHLEVVAAEPDRYELTALGAGGSDPEALIAQARAVRPKVVAVADEAAARQVAEAVPECEVRAGVDALASLAEEADVVVNGVVGFAGLRVTLATLEAGRRLALANKESLIAAGPVVQRARRTPGAELVPVDSEHCAVHMCLRANDNPARVRRIVLTASGGPFRGRPRAELEQVTVDDALDDLARRHGVHRTAGHVLPVAAVGDRDAVTAALRDDPPARLGGVAVGRAGDPAPPGTPSGRAAELVLADGTRIVVRPSGTEA